MRVYEVMDLLGRAPANAEVIISTSLKKEEFLEYGETIEDGIYCFDFRVSDIPDDLAVIYAEVVKTRNE